MGRPDKIIARAHRRVVDRYRITGAEVPADDELAGEVLAELGALLDGHLRKTAKHFRAAAELNILLRRLHGHREAAADSVLTEFDLTMLASGAPVPPEVTDSLGVGPEPWHPEYPRIESD